MRFPTRSAIDKFNEILGLVEDPYMQDWEIECTDPNRVEEFINCYHAHAITDEERFTLMALILGSFEEYHGLNIPNNRIWEKIKNILKKEKNLHREHIEYYRCIESDNEEEWFPVTSLIRNLKL